MTFVGGFSESQLLFFYCVCVCVHKGDFGGPLEAATDWDGLTKMGRRGWTEKKQVFEINLMPPSKKREEEKRRER